MQVVAVVLAMGLATRLEPHLRVEVLVHLLELELLVQRTRVAVAAVLLQILSVVLVVRVLLLFGIQQGWRLQVRVGQ
jgi:hypothetical protein